MTTTYVADGLSSWWRAPMWTLVDGYVYGSVISSLGEALAVKIDPAAGTATTFTLVDYDLAVNIDDHNAAALFVTSDKAPIALYARHEVNDRLYYRIGDGDPGELSFAAEAYDDSFDNAITYAQVWRRPGTDEVHAFTRENGYIWSSLYSTDWGANWSTRRLLVSVGNFGDRTYLITKATVADPDLLRVAVTQHPTDALSTTHDIKVCTIRLSTGDIKDIAGNTLGNLKTGAGLPLTFGDLPDLAVDTDAGHTVRLYDIGDGDTWEIAYSDWEIADGTDSTYRLATLDGTWSSSDIVASGAPFYAASLYFGGLAIPSGSPGGVVFASRESGGTWAIERWTLSGTWSSETIESDATDMLVRPMAVLGASENVLWHRVTAYTDHLDWTGSLEGALATFAPSAFGIEVGFNAPTFTVEADRSVFPSSFGIEVGFQVGVTFRTAADRQVMLTGSGIETPEMTTGGTTGQVLSFGGTWVDSGSTPASTVESETTWGITPAVGSDTEYARQDHTHGTPSVTTLSEAGRWEVLLSEDGSEPMTTEDDLDWLYVWVTD